MSDDNERVGVEDTNLLWSLGSDSVFDGEAVEDEITKVDYDDIDPETGEPRVLFKKLRSLTLREEVFVREYAKGFNPKATMKVLGMTSPEFHGFLSRKPVKAAIQKRALDMAKAADMDQTWVLQNLREVVERCMGSGGDSEDGSRFDASNSLRGLELIGKTMAMFVDKTESNSTNKTIIRIESNVGLVGVPQRLEGSNVGQLSGPKVIEGEVTDSAGLEGGCDAVDADKEA